jgi:hypothetical protein
MGAFTRQRRQKVMQAVIIWYWSNGRKISFLIHCAHQRVREYQESIRTKIRTARTVQDIITSSSSTDRIDHQHITAIQFQNIDKPNGVNVHTIKSPQTPIVDVVDT